jgi:predicted secreted protein
MQIRPSVAGFRTMSIRHSLVLSAVLLAMAGASVAAPLATADAPAPHLTSASGDEAATQVAPGAMFVVFTPPRSLDGHTWRLESFDGDVARAKAGAPFGAVVASTSDSRANEMEWAFEAVNPGDVTLTFSYIPVAGDHAAPTETFSVRVRVQ